MNFRLDFFMEISFHGRRCYGEQSDLGPYCLQYSYMIKSTVSYIRTSTDYKWLNNRSFVKKLNYANCITAFLIYVCFVKEMRKL